MKYFKKLIGDRIYLAPKGISEEELKTFLNVINKMKSNIKCNVNI